MIKFSVVVTIFNEEKSILPLLDSLSHQTLPADEIVLVDAGSHDRTLQLIREWQKNRGTVPIRLLIKEKLNRSKARNVGIEAAANEYVAITDAGCTADKDWLRRLADSFKSDEVEVVAGYYTPVAQTAMQTVFSWYTCVTHFNANTYLPSSRSIAFTKKAWRCAGKYPEHLETCEDLVFARLLKDRCVMAVNEHALVYWEQERQLRGFFAQLARYARGDIEARYWPHVLKIASVFGRYIIFFVFPPLFVVYWLYPIAKQYRLIRRVDEVFFLPMTQIVADVGVMWGALNGLMAKRG